MLVSETCAETFPSPERENNKWEDFPEADKARVHPLLIPAECKQEIPGLGKAALYLLLFCYFYLSKTILSCIPYL